ncbi:hypothetical protein F4780DRAFT_364824 [Xylariomycetidae sp. FL0641]|nr:hypothetical protein F4780DRAFT_364824 [Xylariomycetidae sp. FL0641]
MWDRLPDINKNSTLTDYQTTLLSVYQPLDVYGVAAHAHIASILSVPGPDPWRSLSFSLCLSLSPSQRIGAAGDAITTCRQLHAGFDPRCKPRLCLCPCLSCTDLDLTTPSKQPRAARQHITSSRSAHARPAMWGGQQGRSSFGFGLSHSYVPSGTSSVGKMRRGFDHGSYVSPLHTVQQHSEEETNRCRRLLMQRAKLVITVPSRNRSSPTLTR